MVPATLPVRRQLNPQCLQIALQPAFVAFQAAAPGASYDAFSSCICSNSASLDINSLIGLATGNPNADAIASFCNADCRQVLTQISGPALTQAAPCVTASEAIDCICADPQTLWPAAIAVSTNPDAFITAAASHQSCANWVSQGATCQALIGDDTGDGSDNGSEGCLPAVAGALLPPPLTEDCVCGGGFNLDFVASLTGGPATAGYYSALGQLCTAQCNSVLVGVLEAGANSFSISLSPGQLSTCVCDAVSKNINLASILDADAREPSLVGEVASCALIPSASVPPPSTPLPLSSPMRGREPDAAGMSKPTSPSGSVEVTTILIASGAVEDYTADVRAAIRQEVLTLLRSEIGEVIDEGKIHIGVESASVRIIVTITLPDRATAEQAVPILSAEVASPEAASTLLSSQAFSVSVAQIESGPTLSGGDGSQLSSGALAGVIVGCVVGGSMVVVAFLVAMRMRRRQMPKDGAGQGGVTFSTMSPSANARDLESEPTS